MIDYSKVNILYIRWVHTYEYVDELIRQIPSNTNLFFEAIITEKESAQFDKDIALIASDKKFAQNYLKLFEQLPEFRNIYYLIAAKCTLLDKKILSYNRVDIMLKDTIDLKTILKKELDESLKDVPKDWPDSLKSFYRPVMEHLYSILERDRITYRQIVSIQAKLSDYKSLTLLQGGSHIAGLIYRNKHPEIKFKGIAIPSDEKSISQLYFQALKELSRDKTLGKHTAMRMILHVVYSSKVLEDYGMSSEDILNDIFSVDYPKEIFEHALVLKNLSETDLEIEFEKMISEL